MKRGLGTWSGCRTSSEWDRPPLAMWIDYWTNLGKNRASSVMSDCRTYSVCDRAPYLSRYRALAVLVLAGVLPFLLELPAAAADADSVPAPVVVPPHDVVPPHVPAPAVAERPGQ